MKRIPLAWFPLTPIFLAAVLPLQAAGGTDGLPPWMQEGSFLEYRVERQDDSLKPQSVAGTMRIRTLRLDRAQVLFEKSWKQDDQEGPVISQVLPED